VCPKEIVEKHEGTTGQQAMEIVQWWYNRTASNGNSAVVVQQDSKQWKEQRTAGTWCYVNFL
jgi:hypothetical protein